MDRSEHRRAQIHAGWGRGALSCVLLVAGGCLTDPTTGTSGTPSGNGLPGRDGGPEDVAPPFVEIDGGAPVGPGGLVVASDVATLAVPPGALRMVHNVLVQRSDGPAALPPGMRALSPVVELLPTNLSLAKPATLTIAFTPAATPVYVLGEHGAAWMNVTGTTIDAAGQARADVTSLRRFVVVTAIEADAGADAVIDADPDAAPDAP